MKTTLDLPEELVATLETTARREHRDVSDVAREAIALGLPQRTPPRAESPEDSRQAAEAWLQEWQELGARIREKAVDPRSLVEILAEDRASRG
jgi:Arc/MetJ-type ribon-helix-helix transcriptional regulator